ncbi:14244_t:CDS:2, partial [Gigaspora margarita]
KLPNYVGVEIKLEIIATKKMIKVSEQFRMVDNQQTQNTSMFIGDFQVVVESHLNSQGAVINKELARYNFEFFKQYLCEIWRYNNIHKKQVCINYIDYNEDLFYNKGKKPTTWSWIEHYAQLCCYSLDLQKCSDQNCYNDIYAKEAVDLLKENNVILSPYKRKKQSLFEFNLYFAI